MARRRYSSTAQRTQTTSALSNVGTSLDVAATTGFPAVPFTGLIDPDSALEEVVTVTAVTGLTLTIQRGQDGTAAVSHSPDAYFQHGFSARDFDEPNALINEGGTITGDLNVTGTLSQGGNPVATTSSLSVTVLDDFQFTGRDHTFTTTVNGAPYVIDNPNRALISVDGALLKPFIKPPRDYVFDSPVDSFSGYRLLNDGRIKFARVYSALSTSDARVMPASSAYPSKSQYPFTASDIHLGA